MTLYFGWLCCVGSCFHGSTYAGRGGSGEPYCRLLVLGAWEGTFPALPLIGSLPSGDPVGLGEPALLILRGATVGSPSCVDKDSKCAVSSFSSLSASSGFGG